MTTSQNPSALAEGKLALDKIIRKARVHFYKPIQIAETLYHARTQQDIDITLLLLDTYRRASKHWRDQVTTRLVGRVSISSSRYQDDVFSDTAMPPQLLAVLAEFNDQHDGLVEAYVYRSFEKKLTLVYDALEYIQTSGADSFSLHQLFDLFYTKPGLKRSIDKLYEIAVYALFTTLVAALDVNITLKVDNADHRILDDFSDFITKVLGLQPGQSSVTVPAALYRAGVTNAADAGLDIWANFGPAVQVKHLTLTPEIAENIAAGIDVARIIVVCLDAEKSQIETLAKQLGHRLQAIITLNELSDWYTTSMSDVYSHALGQPLIDQLKHEYNQEFPSNTEITPFLKERGYHDVAFPDDWQLPDD